MKKRLIFFSLGLILILSLSFVSANWFSDVFGTTTGKVTNENSCYSIRGEILKGEFYCSSDIGEGETLIQNYYCSGGKKCIECDEGYRFVDGNCKLYCSPYSDEPTACPASEGWFASWYMNPDVDPNENPPANSKSWNSNGYISQHITSGDAYTKGRFGNTYECWCTKCAEGYEFVDGECVNPKEISFILKEGETITKTIDGTAHSFKIFWMDNDEVRLAIDKRVPSRKFIKEDIYTTDSGLNIFIKSIDAAQISGQSGRVELIISNEPMCFDSDVTEEFPDGKNYYGYGKTSIPDIWSNGRIADKCLNLNLLKESYCLNSSQEICLF